MNKLKLKELWIPAEVLLNEKLSDKEKIILSVILYLSDDKRYFEECYKFICTIKTWEKAI